MATLESSIGAAQDGYAISVDALSIAQSIFGTKPISEDERKGYLEEMHAMAQRGKNNAEGVQNKFRALRRAVISVCLLFPQSKEYKYSNSV